MPISSPIARMLVCFGLALCVTVPNALAEDKVLAVIGSEKVTQDDFKAFSNAVPEQYRDLYDNPQRQKETLEYVVNVFALAEAAEREGLDKSETFKRLTRFLEKDLLARMYLEKKGKDVPEPTEAEAEAYFKENVDKFSVPQSVHLRHILVKTEDEAKKALGRLKKGEEFDVVAAEVSICPTKTRGGDLDWLIEGQLEKPLEEKAFEMKKGEVAGPVKTRFGYHILMLEDKKAARKTSFDEVKDYLMEQLKYQRQQEHYEQVAKKQREKLGVKVNAPRLPAFGKDKDTKETGTGPTK